jgi:hypothetical protein
MFPPGEICRCLFPCPNGLKFHFGARARLAIASRAFTNAAIERDAVGGNQPHRLKPVLLNPHLDRPVAQASVCVSRYRPHRRCVSRRLLLLRRFKFQHSSDLLPRTFAYRHRNVRPVNRTGRGRAISWGCLGTGNQGGLLRNLYLVVLRCPEIGCRRRQRRNARDSKNRIQQRAIFRAQARYFRLERARIARRDDSPPQITEVHLHHPSTLRDFGILLSPTPQERDWL